MSNGFDIIDRAYGLLAAAHKVDVARRMATHQMFYPHTAKEANEGNEREPGVDGGERDSQLEVKRVNLLERSKRWDYRMRVIARQMNKLEAEMMLAVIADDERPKSFIKTPGQES